MGVDIPDPMDTDRDADATGRREGAASEGVPKVVRIRLYRQPRDWNAVCELNFCCGTNGEVNLDELGKELGIEEACRVCSYLDGRIQLTLAPDNRPKNLQAILSVQQRSYRSRGCR